MKKIEALGLIERNIDDLIEKAKVVTVRNKKGKVFQRHLKKEAKKKVDFRKIQIPINLSNDDKSLLNQLKRKDIEVYEINDIGTYGNSTDAGVVFVHTGKNPYTKKGTFASSSLITGKNQKYLMQEIHAAYERQHGHKYTGKEVKQNKDDEKRKNLKIFNKYKDTKYFKVLRKLTEGYEKDEYGSMMKNKNEIEFVNKFMDKHKDLYEYARKRGIPFEGDVPKFDKILNKIKKNDKKDFMKFSHIMDLDF